VTTFPKFFKTATGNQPYGWQGRLACGDRKEAQSDEGWHSRKGPCRSMQRLSRRFIETYPQIRQSVSSQYASSALPAIRQSVITEFHVPGKDPEMVRHLQKHQPTVGESDAPPEYSAATGISAPAVRKSSSPVTKSPSALPWDVLLQFLWTPPRSLIEINTAMQHHA
jgi:hypothetical protein